MEFQGIGTKVIDGITYHYEVMEKDFERKVFTTIEKVGDAVFVDWGDATGLKVDYPVKIFIQELHNEKVVIAEPQEYPEFIDTDNGLPPVKTKEGITTIVKGLNPIFTVQLKINPKNWGTLKKLSIRKSREVEIPEVVSSDKWQNELLQGTGVWELLTEQEKSFLTTRTNINLRQYLWDSLSQQKLTGWLIQALFHLPTVQKKTEYYYEELPEERKSRELKDVDIEIEVIGEDYTTTININKGSLMNRCDALGNIVGTFQYYYFETPVLPLICDWLNISMPKIEKKRFGKFRKGDE